MNDSVIWSPGVTLEDIEKQVILLAFRHFRGNKTTAANALGISVKTLHTKLEKYEADGKQEKERREHERLDREAQLRRARGILPDNVGIPYTESVRTADTFANSESQSTHGADAGFRVESAQEAQPQSSVSLPERSKVQSVLPGPVAPGGPRRNR